MNKLSNKKKKIFLISLISLLIAVGIFSHVANQIEGRSSLSKLVEIVLWIVRDDASDIKQVQANLEASAEVSDQPYTLPLEMILDTKFNLDNYEGMQVAIAQGKEAVTLADLALKEDQPLIIYLHGGSYISQPSIVHWAFLDSLGQATEAAIIAPIYPKAPRHSFIESYELLIPLYLELAERFGADRIQLIGDSAGGGLALGLAQALLESAVEQPANIILISPWFDLALDHPDIPDYEALDPMLSQFKLQIYGRSWAGDTALDDYRVSPLYGPIEGLGALTVFVGTHEIFLPDTRDFRDRVEATRTVLHYFEYPLMNHIFPLYPIPEAKLAQEQIAAIILEQPLPETSHK